jgi:hypothetical protein
MKMANVLDVVPDDFVLRDLHVADTIEEVDRRNSDQWLWKEVKAHPMSARSYLEVGVHLQAFNRHTPHSGQALNPA